MTLEQALPYLRNENGAIRRRGRAETITHKDLFQEHELSAQDLLATDWEGVGETFAVALNALLQGYKIRHIGDDVEGSLMFLSGKLYAGLGTCKAREYTFTEKDTQSNDWVIEGGVRSGS